MDIREFATEFMDNINNVLELENEPNNLDEELTSSILDYLEASGEVGAPILCPFRKRSAAINAYDYNDEGNSLDLFVLVPTKTILGKINNSKIDQAFSGMFRFYKEVIDGYIHTDNSEENEELQEVAELIEETKGKLSTLRLFVLTNGLAEYTTTTIEDPDNNFIMEQVVWDMQRIYQQNCLMSGKDRIEIDFPTMYDEKLQCLKMAQNNQEVDAYLAIIPGITLARIYKNYQQALLEKNVRTFLQFKSKVNRGIRKTLQEEPDMFFSFNNGISTTASAIDTIEEDGSLYITRLVNWQIVNGGQTTASIAATYSEKGTDLTKVFVPMKISVIKDQDRDSEIVANISRYANSQTAIKDSDFSSNDPYLVDLENFSRSEWIPNGNSKSTTKWYFERTRGQYLDELAQLTGFNERTFKTTYPKSHRFVKTDIAKVISCWEQRPDQVCKGAEKNYVIFVKDCKAAPIKVTKLYYQRLVALLILYKAIDKIIKSKDLGGYKSNMDNYVMASLSLISKKSLNLDEIWENQEISSELKDIIDSLIPIVWKHITDPKTSSRAQSVNINEWTKRQECWNNLKRELDSFEKIPTEMLFSPENMIDPTINDAQKQKIALAWEISSDTWFGAAKWAKEHGYLTPIERKMAFSFGKFKSSNRMLSFKQANAGLNILAKLKEAGFEY